MKKFFLGVAITLVLVLVVLFGLAVYFGFVPGLSDNFIKRVDLGIENDSQIYLDMADELGFKSNLIIDGEPTKSELIYKGSLDVDRYVDSKDITSLLNIWSSEYYYTPFSNVQIRLNEDGTVEASLDLNVADATEIASKLGYSDEEIAKGKNYLDILSNEVYIYTKFSTETNNNDISATASTFRVQNFTVPSQFYEPIARVITDMVEKKVNQVGKVDIESIKQEGDRMHFIGTIPQNISTKE